MAVNQYEKNVWDPELLSRVGDLEWLSKLIMDGTIQGLHRSPYHGFSAEFSEFRLYSQGDDLRFLDWQVLARHDRPFIRRFEAETNLRALVVLDISKSMAYRSKDRLPTKFQYAATLAAAIIRLFNLQNDAAGLALVRDAKVLGMVEPATGITSFHHCLSLLESTAPEGAGELSTHLPALAQRLKGRGQLILISDFMHELTPLTGSMRLIATRRNDISIIQVLDPEEREFTASDSAIYEDMETGTRLPINPRWLKKRYLEEMQAHQDALKSLSLDYESFFRSISTQEAPFRVLAELLMHRRSKL